MILDSRKLSLKFPSKYKGKSQGREGTVEDVNHRKLNSGEPKFEKSLIW